MPALRTMKPHVEKVVFGFGMFNPILALPQVYKVWALGSVGGLSLITLGAAMFMALLMTTYGLLERSAALWGPSAVWIAVNALLIGGVLKFG